LFTGQAKGLQRFAWKGTGEACDVDLDDIGIAGMVLVARRLVPIGEGVAVVRRDTDGL
jgi:hypothetical protein